MKQELNQTGRAKLETRVFSGLVLLFFLLQFNVSFSMGVKISMTHEIQKDTLKLTIIYKNVSNKNVFIPYPNWVTIGSLSEPCTAFIMGLHFDNFIKYEGYEYANDDYSTTFTPTMGYAHRYFQYFIELKAKSIKTLTLYFPGFLSVNTPRKKLQFIIGTVFIYQQDFYKMLDYLEIKLPDILFDNIFNKMPLHERSGFEIKRNNYTLFFKQILNDIVPPKKTCDFHWAPLNENLIESCVEMDECQRNSIYTTLEFHTIKLIQNINIP